MGYELKMYLADVSTLADKDYRFYFNTIAMVDLCKCCERFNTIVNQEREKSKIHVYLYDGMGENEEKLTEDAYGQELVAVPALPILKALNMINTKSYYRRYAIAIELLKQAIIDFDDLKLVFFGH